MKFVHSSDHEILLQFHDIEKVMKKDLINRSQPDIISSIRRLIQLYTILNKLFACHDQRFRCLQLIIVTLLWASKYLEGIAMPLGK